VFDADYKLSKPSEIKAYVNKNHHLPEIPSADQMAKDGLNLSDMNTKLLKKVEELTLYLIAKDKQLTKQEKKLEEENRRITALEKAMKANNKPNEVN
jgi:hypothetical protein